MVTVRLPCLLTIAFDRPGLARLTAGPSDVMLLYHNFVDNLYHFAIAMPGRRGARVSWTMWSSSRSGNAASVGCSASVSERMS